MVGDEDDIYYSETMAVTYAIRLLRTSLLQEFHIDAVPMN